MKLELYREISLGDMTARYLRDRETGQVELQLLPQDMAAVSESDRLRKALHNVVQAHLTGEGQPGTYGGGVTLLQSGTTRSLCLEGLDCRTENGIVQVIADFTHPTGCRFRHHLEWDGHRPILTSWSEAENRGESDVSLELLTSFSLGGMTPLLPDAAPGALRLPHLAGVRCALLGAKGTHEQRGGAAGIIGTQQTPPVAAACSPKRCRRLLQGAFF